MTGSSRTAVRAAVATGAAAAGLTLITIGAASARPGHPARAVALGGPRATLLAQLAGGNTALDASPDPAGTVVYFTANGAHGPAVLRVPAAGGPATPVLAGAPLRGPVGLAVSNDGRQLFVADPRAGHVLVVPAAGGTPHILRGTAGSAPRGLEVETLGGQEFVVFAGRDARDGRPAVLRVSARGARRPTVVVEDRRLRRPDGVAISRTGAIYVTDQGAGGRVLRIDGARVTTLPPAVRLGRPAGIALSLDESKLLISSLNPTRATAQVLIVDLRTGHTRTFDDVIGRNHNAGGLHRARRAALMGWADVSRSGRVYRVDP